MELDRTAFSPSRHPLSPILGCASTTLTAEAEKSGNGLRIFAKFLSEHRFASATRFTVETLGGVVRCDVRAKDRSVAEIHVDMGLATFRAGEIPVAG